jgi:hypothetical protein
MFFCSQTKFGVHNYRIRVDMVFGAMFFHILQIKDAQKVEKKHRSMEISFGGDVILFGSNTLS